MIMKQAEVAVLVYCLVEIDVNWVLITFLGLVGIPPALPQM